MKKISFVVFFMVFLFSACDNRRGDQKADDTVKVGPGNSNSSGIDTSANPANDFIMEAASGGLMEVELGKLAQQKAVSREVKNFGSRMVTDHSKANNDLKQVAKMNNIALPDSMMDKHKDMIDDLRDETGTDFDKKYMDMMVDDHSEDVDNFEDYSKDNADSPVGKWAAKTLPVLREHLSLAKQVNEKLK